MIYDVRIYNFHPGKVPEYMKAVREVGLPIRKDHGVELAAWFHSVIGELNQVIHVWAYQSLAHMEKAKAEVEADPRWFGEYVPRVQPLIVKMRDQIMLAPDFSPQAS